MTAEYVSGSCQTIPSWSGSGLDADEKSANGGLLPKNEDGLVVDVKDNEGSAGFNEELLATVMLKSSRW